MGGSVGCVLGVPGHADGQWRQRQGDVEEVQSEGGRVVGEGRRVGTGECGGYEADDVAAGGDGHGGQVAGEDDADPPLEGLLGQRGVERAGEPATTADRDVLGGSEPGRGQGFFGEVVAGPDGRHHAQTDQFFDLGFGIYVVDGSDLQIDPAVAECRSGLQLFGPEPERDPRRLLLGQLQQSGGSAAPTRSAAWRVKVLLRLAGSTPVPGLSSAPRLRTTAAASSRRAWARGVGAMVCPTLAGVGGQEDMLVDIAIDPADQRPIT